MDFVALDVETANADYSSICQIGIVEFSDRKIVGSWSTLVDPISYFDPYNTSIHGIDASAVVGAPTYSKLFPELSERLHRRLVLHHGHFDYTAFKRCYDRFSLSEIECDWLDNTKVVRRTWDEFQNSGYGLKNLCTHFGIELSHHDALSDATAAGEVFLKAMLATNTTPSDWLPKVRLRVNHGDTKNDIRRDGEIDAPFFGETIVFTGSLTVERKTAADVAQKLGFDVAAGVTKKTTYLCVGVQDPTSLAGYSKSSKHRKAEDLAIKGQQVSFLSEDDFWALAKIHSNGETP
ncbi:exonuclease domain-containing protein [Tateyamaria sp.]|uniref:exonuclease domain-containing protein n=1 Tax=Tateyamaria sp. TaxID=1929288 RepID=UPI00329CDA96